MCHDSSNNQEWGLVDTIAALRREGFCSAEIARRLGRHNHLEKVRRNSSPSDATGRARPSRERTDDARGLAGTILHKGRLCPGGEEA